jgi:hypothetical protein
MSRIHAVRKLTAALCALAASGLMSDCASPLRADSTPVTRDASMPLRQPATDGKSAMAQCNTFTGQRLYIGTAFGGIVVVKAYKTAADAPMLCHIQPVQGEIGGLALDANRNLWVSNESVPALTLYAHAANGVRVAPLQVISGSATLLLPYVEEALKGIGIDPLTGDVWVPNLNQSDGGAYLTAYASTATGNVPPIHSIGYADRGAGEGLVAPVDIKFDAAGNMFVGDVHHVEIYQRPFTDTSKPVAVFTMQGRSYGWYLAFDARGNLYASGQQYVTLFKGGLKSGGRIAGTFQCSSLSTLAFDPRSRFYSADLENTVNVSTRLPQNCTISRKITNDYFESAVPVAVAVGL